MSKKLPLTKSRLHELFGGVKVDQGRLDQFAVASARRAVQTLRERCIEGYVVFEGDPTCYEFTP